MLVPIFRVRYMLVAIFSCWLQYSDAMASLFGKKLKRVRGLRGFSDLAATGTCVIRGVYQDVFFPDWKWESLSDHAATYPLVSNVRGGLITVNQRWPLKINDHWRKLLYTGLVHSIICKRKRDCIHNAYDLNNIGVIKGLNIFGFRSFERMEDMKNNNHEEYIRFVHNLFSELCGPSVLQQVCEVNNFLGLLSGDPSVLQQVCDVDTFLHQFSDGFPDVSMLCNPFFLNDDEMANFYVDAHRLVRHEFPVRKAGCAAANILRDMEYNYWSNDRCVKACKGSLLFKHLLGRHEKTAEIIKLYKEPRFGSAVMDIPRNVVTHSIERNVLDKARAESTSLSEKDLLYNYSRAEVIEGARHMFTLYPQVVVCSFLANNVWRQLKMKERLPVPSIYGYVSP